jgi:DNA polymerase-3 subunit gamma/tau
MSYIALYREWRPSVFEDVVEQEHVVKTLRYSVGTGRIAHAYLFCGTRGTGKTTMAHILSRAINCLNPNNGDPCNKCEVCREILSGSSMDVLEIDAASNNSVDNVREIREEVIYAPSRARFKVYIIDEVHMLSTGAFNALLKTLEEPPAHVVFILATTEPHKLPATILSRCQRFDFRRISIESIVKRLEKITEANSLKLDPDAARLIAKLSDGALRDAISLLDQCISLGSSHISYEDVLSVVGIVNDTFMSEMAGDILAKNTNGLLEKVNRLVMDGRDIPHFISDLVRYCRNLLICKAVADPGDIVDVQRDVLDIMKTQSRDISQDEIISMIKELSALEASLKWASNPRILLEVTLLKLCEERLPVDAGLAERVAALEKMLAEGNPRPQAPVKEIPQAGTPRRGPGAGESAAITAPRPAAAPSKPSAEVRYLENWEAVLAHLKSLGRMTVYSYLIDTKAVELEGDYLGVVFESRSSYAKSTVSRAENIEIIETAASKILGRDIKVKCLDGDSLAVTPVKKPAAEKDEFVEKARRLAERAGVPFEIIDE